MDVAKPAAASATTTASARVTNKVMDVLDPLLSWLLKPLKSLVTWLYNRFLADKPVAAKPMYKPITPRPESLVLYVP